MMWQRDTSQDCPDEDEGNTALTDGSTSYNITGLEEDSNYIVTVTAMNEFWNTTTNNITATTRDDGIAIYCQWQMFIKNIIIIHLLQLRQLLPIL